jgi:hypothetical protein
MRGRLCDRLHLGEDEAGVLHGSDRSACNLFGRERIVSASI